ncbi:MAG: hypothetical protein AABP62_04560 [Planctomycetota bacterium]
MRFSARFLSGVFLVMIVCVSRDGPSALCAADRPAARTLLFVDDHDVLYRSGTRRELHPLTRHADNPLLTGTVPKNQIGYCSVVWPGLGRFAKPRASSKATPAPDSQPHSSGERRSLRGDDRLIDRRTTRI